MRLFIVASVVVIARTRALRSTRLLEAMLCMRLFAVASSPLSFTFSAHKHRRCLKLAPAVRACSQSVASKSSINMSSTTASQTIEHVVLFKVKEDANPSKVNEMVSGLNGLLSLDPVLHLTAGPLIRNRSSGFSFTHMLHSRYSSKDGLAMYTDHPEHLRVVKESVLPVCDDILAVDWVVEPPPSPVAPGAAIKVMMLKLKEGLPEEAKDEVLGVIKGIKQSIPGIDQITYGENFSPARAKGFSIASIAVFRDLSEMEAVDSKEELVNLHKDKVRDYLESVIVVDYVVPASQSSSL